MPNTPGFPRQHPLLCFYARIALSFAVFSGIAFVSTTICLGQTLLNTNLSPGQTSVGANGGSGELEVVATGHWNAVSSDSWLAITSGSSGNGNGKLDFSVAPNPFGTTRMATITITDSTNASASSIVTQAGGSFSISPSSANVNASGGSGTITVNTSEASLQWTAIATSGASWLTVISGGTGAGPGSVNWTASVNNTAETRTGTITVTPQGGTGIPFTVSQAAGSPPCTLMLTPSSLNVDAAGGSGSIQVICNGSPVSWTASSSDLWFKLTAGTSGSGAGTISYTASGNINGTQRTATVTVTPSQGTPITLSVTQSAGVLVVSPSSANPGSSGGTGSISLTTSDAALMWTASVNQTWATISATSGTGSGTISWTVAANTSTSGRTAVVTITPRNGTGQTFTINQAGVTLGTISLNPGSAHAPASISNGSTQVTSTDPSLTWTAVSSDTSWLTITSSVTGTGTGTIQYMALGTPSGASRMATITVTPTDGTAPAVFTVTQDPGVLTLNPTSATAQPAGGTGSVALTTNNTTLQWTASSSDSWLTFTVSQIAPTRYNSGAQGIGDATVSWAAAANTGTSPRTATISATPLNGSPVVFTVTQAALTGTLAPNLAALEFSYQQLGPLPTDKQLTINSTPGGIPFTASASTQTGTWLAVSGVGPASAVLTVSVNPSGLSAGTYTGTVTLTSTSATNSPISVPVTLIVTPAPVLMSVPNALTFSFQQGGLPPGTQTISLTTSGPPLDYTIAQDPSAPWLTASGAGPAPSTITVTVSPDGLQPGTYTGNVILNAPTAGNNPFIVPVTFRVSAAPNLIPSPTSLSITLTQLQPAPQPITLAVTSSAADLNFTATTTAPWLTVSGAGHTPSNLQVTVNAGSLSPGTHQAAVVLTSAQAGNSPVTVPVTLTLIAGASLTAQPAQITFGQTVLTPGGPTATVTVSSDPSVPFTTTVQTTSGGNWLSVSSSNSSTPSVLTISATGGLLPPGTYNGTVTLTSSQAVNSPLTIPVTLTVSTLPQLTVSPNLLRFGYQLLSGSSVLPDQPITVRASNNSDVPVTATAITLNGGDWLSVTAGGDTPATLQVGADATGLAAGIYGGSITLTSPGYAPAIVPVGLVVTVAPQLRVFPTSMTFSSQQGNVMPPAQSLSIGSSSGSLSFAATGDSNTWLSVTGSGHTPGSVSVAVNPTGLAPGTYQGTVSVTSEQAANSPVAIPVTFTIAAGPTITDQPASLSFTYTQLGTIPDPQSIGLGSVQPLSFSTSISPAESWLSVSPSGQSTPANLRVSVNPTGLDPGQYTATILVNAPGAANNPVPVNVSLTVNAAPTMTSSPSQFAFSYQVGATPPSNQTLLVTGSDPSLIVTATGATTSGGSWLSVTGGGNVPALFSISATPGTLSPGIYNGAVTLLASGAGNSPMTIPVTLVVSPAPVLVASPSQLTLSYQIGGTVPTITPFQVTSSGSAITFQASASTDTGGAWLQVSSGGTTPLSVTPTIDPTDLAAGTYTGTISLSSDAAGNNPVLIPVSLTVSTSTTLTAAPTSLQFSAQQNGSAPASQSIQITSGGTPIAVNYMTSPGASWLTVTGDAMTPANVSVSVSATGLAPGTYTAVILVQSPLAGSPLQIPVVLTVTPTPSINVSPNILTFSYVISGTRPSPQSVSVTSSGAPVNFTFAITPGPAWLFSSGSGTTPGNVSVAVDPGVLTPGVYTGSVVVTPANGTPVLLHVVLNVANTPVLSSQPTQLSFAYQVNGSTPSSQTLLIQSDPVSVTTAAAAQTFSGGDWLAVTGGGGTPAPLSISVNPVGLIAGVYHGQIVVASSGASNSPLNVPVTLTVSGSPVLNSTVNFLQFTAQTGGAPSTNQQITVTASDGSAVQVSAQPSAGISWLTIGASSTTTPAVFTVGANPGVLSAGVYSGSVIFSSPTAGSLSIPVIFTITQQPTILASPQAVAFSAQTGATPPQPISVAIAGAVPLTFTAAPAPGAPWLSVTGGGITPSAITISVNQTGLTSGTYQSVVFVSAPGAANSPLVIPVSLVVTSAPIVQVLPNTLSFTSSTPPSQTFNVSAPGQFTTSISPSTPWLSITSSGSTVTVSVNGSGLSPGSYQGSVIVDAPGTGNSPVSVPVTFQSLTAPSLQANPASLTFAFNSTGALPPPQNVAVTLGGSPATGAQATVAPGSPWLSVQTASGGMLTVAVNPTGLLAGTYTGSVQVAASGAANSPLTIPVSFTVTGSPLISFSADAIALAALPAQSQPVSETLVIGGGSNTPVNINLNVTASTWLSVSPTSGTTPFTVTVTADPTGLRVGNYSGSIMASSDGNQLKTIPVNLTIASQPTVSVAPQFLVFNYFNGGDTPNPVNIYFFEFMTSAAIMASASDPWISVNPSSVTTSGVVQVSVQPAGLATGAYHGSVTLVASATPGGAPIFTKQIPVDLYVNQPADPLISGVASGMSFYAAQLAPGLIFSIFGTGLGPSTPVQSQIQPDQTLAQSLGGVQVLVNGISCPLLYVSATQVNAIAPYALYTNSSAKVTVRYNGVLSNEVPVPVVPSEPGLFSQSQGGSGLGAILNQDQSVNSDQNPAAKGSIISLFGGGEGQTVAQGIDGLIASGPVSSLPQPLLPVSVTIGGIPATNITYAGAAPTLTAGALQINVQIPDNVPSGDQPVVITVGTNISQGGLTVSVR